MILPQKRDAAHAGRTVVRFAESTIPTDHGDALCVVFQQTVDETKEHVALVFGDISGDDVLVRVHSECITSEVFGSLKCDCALQLESALSAIEAAGSGVLIYLRQEGRGIGLGNKIRAYALQEEGADTVDANHQLGFDTDLRSYDIAADMLHDLGVHSVALMTNNPEKIAGLEANGVNVTRRVPSRVPDNEHSAGYLDTKRDRLGHLID